MKLPDNLNDLLPEFKSDGWRENQKEVVEEIVDGLAGRKPVGTVLVNAPTGAGKTVIGAATSRAMNANALYLAHTIVLQKQQLNTLPGATTATGRRNHRCNVADEQGDQEFFGFPEFTAEDAQDMGWCETCPLAAPNGCTYYAQWFNATKSRDAVLNYAYITRVAKAPVIRVADGTGSQGPELNLLPNPFVNRELMICDEGHNLEKAILDADTITINEKSFHDYGCPTPDTDDFLSWVAWMQDIYPRVVSHLEDAKRKMNASKSTSARRDVRRLKSMLTALDGISDLAGIGQTEQGPTVDTIYVGRRGESTTIQPIWVWNRAREVLFRHAKSNIVMSATLGDMDLAARLLGLGKNYRSVEIPSTFPVENRPIAYWPVSRMSYDTPESSKSLQGLALSYLARLFPTQPGVVHCNSYVLGQFIADIVRQTDPNTFGRIITHDAKTREQTHAAFERDPRNSILITPAATTGVDWDFVHWQMIPKIPYPDLSDPIVKLRKEYVDEDGEELGSIVYVQEAIKTLVQACGRNVRTPKSLGITLITDAGFWALFKHIAPHQFPDWFRDAVRWTDHEPDLEEHLEALRNA